MKVLWISNSPDAPSGYGTQTRQVGRRIASAGHEIEFIANDGTRGEKLWEGHVVRGSSGTDRYSRDVIAGDIASTSADWAISLYDAWVYGGKELFGGFPRVAGWIPIDHFPVPAVLYEWLRGGHLNIAMSRYGEQQLAQLRDSWAGEGGKPFEVRYAPHAIEDVYRPVKTDFRDVIDVPEDAFLVGIVAANTDTLTYDRKGFNEMVMALAAFMSRHADAYLYLHTLQRGHLAMDLGALISAAKVPEERVMWADPDAIRRQRITDDAMATIYSSLDLLLATSRGEGFGLPVLEAQACGVPAIVSNFSAQTELVTGEPFSSEDMRGGEYANGWTVSTLPDWDPRQVGWYGKPDIPSIIACLERAYAAWRAGRWQERRDAAVERASAYRADAVFDRYWAPILDEMQAQVPVPLNREQRRAIMRAGAK